MAGKKGRSGRKPDLDLLRARDVLARGMRPGDEVEIVKRVVQKALSPELDLISIKAVELLWKYRYGLPAQMVPPTPDRPPIHLIQIAPDPGPGPDVPDDPEPDDHSDASGP